MAKKLSKAKKRAIRKSSNNSLFEKLFTFSNIVIISAILLSAFTFYQVLVPSGSAQSENTVQK